jgi:mannitol-1-/sugar-/sorbitol-6-phosphatase
MHPPAAATLPELRGDRHKAAGTRPPGRGAAAVTTILGLAAGGLTTCAWLPQVIHAIRTRSTRDLSWLYLLAFALGTVGWLTYGVIRGDTPVSVANVITFTLVLALCATKARSELAGQAGGHAAGVPDAVLFDMGGTLVDSDAAVQHSWAAWAAKHHIDLSRVLQVSPGKPAAQAMAELAPHLTVEQIAADAAEHQRREVSDLDSVMATAGAAELVRKVQESGTRWAVVTSASRALATVRLRACGLPMPPVLVTWDDVKHGKPDPEGYQLAAALLGAEPSRCVVIEDTHAGIRAGLAARMTVIGTGPRVHGWLADRACIGHMDHKPHRWVNDLTQLSATPIQDKGDGRALCLKTHTHT